MFATIGTLTERQRRTLAGGRAHRVELRLLPAHLVAARFALPGGAADYMEQIIEHRLERLTPWKAEHVLYGFSTTPRPDGQFDIDFLATSQDIAAASIDRLAALDMVPTVLGNAAEPLDAPVRIDLFRGRENTMRHRTRARVGAVAVAVLVAAIGLAAASSFQRAASERHLANIETQLAAARRSLVDGSAVDPEHQRLARMIDRKTPQNAVFVLVDRLSGAIPVDTFLDQLDIQPQTVQLSGSSANASALIGIFETELGLSSAQFEAPVTRQDDGRDRFQISVTRAATEQTALR